jgi:tRNA threonylcarbamoyl adenosine modification protein (Sua5/YciO/YrdC/YwlC family)
MKVNIEDALKDSNLRNKLAELIKEGAVFIYPTDTIYGIGCDASNRKSVERIREMKKAAHPFSIIAPSKIWIREHLILKEGTEKYLDKLPGPLTLILRKRDKNFLKTASPTWKLGVRIPNHPFTGIIRKSGRPFITTSVNISGRPFIKDIREVPKHFSVDVIVDSGILRGDPSVVVDLTGKKPKIIRK